MTGGDTVLEGVVIDDGKLLYTASEHQRLVNLTHALVFLKRDAQLAEVCARRCYGAIRRHLIEWIFSLSDDESPGAVEADLERGVVPV